MSVLLLNLLLGVRIKHSAILNRMKWQWRTFPYSSTEKVCVFKTALTFVDSVCELWGPLLNARSILILSKEDTKNPEKLTALLEKHEVNILKENIRKTAFKPSRWQEVIIKIVGGTSGPCTNLTSGDFAVRFYEKLKGLLKKPSLMGLLGGSSYRFIGEKVLWLLWQ